MQVVEVDLRNQSDLIDVDGLQYYKNLARLNLSGCSAVQGDERMKKTVSILNNVSTLVSLDVSQNKLQASKAAVLAQGIANWPLTSLNLASNSLGVEGVKIIAAVLPKCMALSMLSLKDNRLLTAEAGKILSHMVATNTVLKELDLSSNNWKDRIGALPGDGPGFAQELAVGIRDNGVLTKLIFGGDFKCDRSTRHYDVPYEPAALEVGMTEADFSNKNLGTGGAIIIAGWLTHKDMGRYPSPMPWAIRSARISLPSSRRSCAPNPILFLSAASRMMLLRLIYLALVWMLMTL
jgi:hypothetical protein